MAQVSPDKISDQLKDQVKESLEPILADMSKAVESLSSEIEGIPQLIKKYPIQSVLIGFGIGVVGALLLRKSK
jgi:ElaB/YqjD/DUF883 family membrane-anchored ribosome-binding protein